MKRHIARLLNTDQRCIVVMMQIPDREDHALICSIDNLPLRYEQSIMTLLESPEGQREESLYHLLERRIMPDSGKTVLRTLHEEGMLTAIPVNRVIMMPRPNMPFPLADLLRQMGRIVPGELEPTKAATGTADKYNVHTENRAIIGAENASGIANNLLIEATMLEADARRKRTQAYALNPTLRPVLMESPVQSPVQTPDEET